MRKLGKYAMMHLESLAENRPDRLDELERTGHLQAHLESLDLDARALKKRVLSDLLKDNADMTTGEKAMFEKQAEEVVLHDLVLVPDLETERARQNGGYSG